jgi:1-deoxy-D-xylulose-5-phosphate synthase
VTLEENSLRGGFGEAVAACLRERSLAPPLLTLGLPAEFVPQGTRRELLAELGLDGEGVARRVRAALAGMPTLASGEAGGGSR